MDWSHNIIFRIDDTARQIKAPDHRRGTRGFNKGGTVKYTQG